MSSQDFDCAVFKMQTGIRSSHEVSMIHSQAVDYTCVLNVQFGCAFHFRMHFRCHFQCQKLSNDIKNVFDSETHIQNASVIDP
jgi:hypothetical protein